MDSGQLALAFFFMVLGVLVYRFPNLIAGYNTMPEEEKAKVDVEGLKKWSRNMFVIIGVLLIIANYVSHSLSFVDPDYVDYAFYVIVVVGLVILVAGAQKFKARN